MANDNRAKEASKYITHKDRVVDLGSGDKVLLKYIDPKFYLGVDKEGEDALIRDFNTITNLHFLDRYKVDTAVMLGLLRWLNDPIGFLKMVCAYDFKKVILSCPAEMVDIYTFYLEDKFKVTHEKLVCGLTNLLIGRLDA